MRRVTKRTWLGWVLALSTLAVYAGAAETTLLHKQAPQIVRRDLSGRVVNLRANRGKVVLLNFWATWCAPCQVELPRFESWQKQYGAQGFGVIAISMDDDPGPVRKLVHKLGLDFPVAVGDAALGERYGGVLGLPVTLLIARDGTVVARWQGETPLAGMEEQIKQQLAGR